MLSGKVASSDFKHNKAAVSKLLVNKGNSTVAKEDFYIIFPERYIAKGLAVMGSSIKLLFMFAIVDTKMNYGTVLAPIMNDVVASNVKDILVDGVANKVLEIQAGDIVIPNRAAVMNAGFMYDLVDEFIMQGKVPWYMSYDDLSNIVAEASKYAGSNVGNDPLAMEIITAMVARDSKDKMVSYRTLLIKGGKRPKPSYVGLTNVYYSYDNTLSKIMGGYMRHGVTTAIAIKEKQTTKASAVLRA